MRVVKFMSLNALILQIIYTKRVSKGLKNGILCPFRGKIDFEDLFI